MMKKRIVILCTRLYLDLPHYDSGWKYYHDILGIYVSPGRDTLDIPKYYKPWMLKGISWFRDKLFSYMLKNKTIVKEYHHEYIKRMNENSKDGTVYV